MQGFWDFSQKNKTFYHFVPKKYKKLIMLLRKNFYKTARVIRVAFISDTSNREFPLGLLKLISENWKPISSILYTSFLVPYLKQETRVSFECQYLSLFIVRSTFQLTKFRNPTPSVPQPSFLVPYLKQETKVNFEHQYFPLFIVHSTF